MACAILAAAASMPPAAERLSAKTAGPAIMRVFGAAQPPYGFVQFCDANPSQCKRVTGAETRFPATPHRLSELDDTNRYVNRTISPETDAALYGVSEHWTLPKTRGDCEDYALLKRALLMKRGWPASSLLLTVVRDEKGEGHAVLTARTLQGDYVLDNKVEDVRLWNVTPYTYVMRQSYLDPQMWVSLDPLVTKAPPAIAGVYRNGDGSRD